MTIIPEWRVILMRNDPGSAEVQQNITQWVNLDKSLFQPTKDDKPARSNMFISFPRDTPDIVVKEKREVWAGWVDPTTNEWISVWFGGYIQRMDGYTIGGEHVFECDLGDYGILLGTTQVIGWPSDWSIPGLIGMAPGYSVAQWLFGVGDAPNVGIWYEYFQIVTHNYDTIFDDIIMDEQHLPGNSEVAEGQWGWTTVKKVLDDLMDMAKYIESGVKIVYYVRAVPSPFDATAVCPSLHIMDKNQARTPRARFSTNPAEGEYWMRHPFKHGRDASAIMGRVTVKGVGGDPTLVEQPIVSYTAINADHIAAYPTKYQKEPGWSGDIIFDTRIDSSIKAQSIAEHIEEQTWAARGQVTFNTDFLSDDTIEPLAAGDVIHIEDENENLDQDEFINQVVFQGGSTGHPVFEVSVGQREVDISDIIKGGTLDIPWFETNPLTIPGVGSRPRLSSPGVPREIPIESTPTHSARNIVKPLTDQVIGLVFQQPKRIAPFTDDPPAPKNLVETRDKYENVHNWYDAQGGDHPHHYLTYFPGPGLALVTTVDQCSLVVMKVQNEDGTANTDVTVDLKLNGTTVSAPTTTAPLNADIHNVISITVSGTVPTTGVTIILTESMPVVIPP
jgi:hypothetical protein